MDERLLLNLLLSVSPAVVYLLVSMNVGLVKETTRAQVATGILCGTAAVLCMNYPVVVGNGFLWDLRWVPFLFAVTYGRTRGGVVCAVILIGYRFFLGGVLSSLVVVVDALVILLVTLTYQTRKQESQSLVGMLMRSTVLAAGTYVFVMGTIFLYMAYINNAKFFIQQGILFYLIYGFITVVAYLCSVLLMENFFLKQLVQSELEQTERLHLLTDMAASFAHEIRNPLTVAMGFMQLLQQSAADDKRKQHLQLVSSELQRAEGIIHDYLTYARPSVNDVKVFSIKEALERVVGVMSPFAAMNNVQITISSESPWSIQVNEQKFTQVLMNLIKNAIEAIDSGGTVKIDVDQRDDHVFVEITDDGIGMTKFQLLQLGKPYYSTKTNGTGVGLMVTFQLVKLMGGKLRYSSKAGRGTTAALQFPLFPGQHHGC